MFKPCEFLRFESEWICDAAARPRMGTRSGPAKCVPDRSGFGPRSSNTGPGSGSERGTTGPTPQKSNRSTARRYVTSETNTAFARASEAKRKASAPVSAEEHASADRATPIPKLTRGAVSAGPMSNGRRGNVGRAVARRAGRRKTWDESPAWHRASRHLQDDRLNDVGHVLPCLARLG